MDTNAIGFGLTLLITLVGGFGVGLATGYILLWGHYRGDAFKAYVHLLADSPDEATWKLKRLFSDDEIAQALEIAEMTTNYTQGATDELDK